MRPWDRSNGRAAMRGAPDGGGGGGAKAAEDAISAEAAHRAALAGDLTLVDIRTPQEWSSTGAPEGAVTLAMQDPRFGEQLLAMIHDAPERPVALICASGGRTGHVLLQLKQIGVEGVRHVAEGMTGSPAGPGWLAKGLPVTPFKA